MTKNEKKADIIFNLLEMAYLDGIAACTGCTNIDPNYKERSKKQHSEMIESILED